MFAKLLLFFTVVPVAELALLIWLGGIMGVWPTVGLVIVTAFLGSFLAKQQGLAAWRQLQTDLAEGKTPQDALLDGIAVLIAAVLLITPGVLSDIAGILLMIPACRRPLKRYLKRRFIRSISERSVQFIDMSAAQDPRQAPPGGPGGARSPFGGASFGNSPFGDSPFNARPRFDDGEVIDVTPSSTSRGEA